MENHPIPQDVTGFQFKLIGNMTVKQFAYLAVGVVLAWIFNAFPFFFIIKFPLMLLCAGIGAGLAFLPVEGRPMDVMVRNFFKALLNPTQFVYQKIGGHLVLPDTETQTAKTAAQQTTTSLSGKKLQAFLQTLPQKSNNQLDDKEMLFFKKLSLAHSDTISQTPRVLQQQAIPPIGQIAHPAVQPIMQPAQVPQPAIIPPSSPAQPLIQPVPAAPQQSQPYQQPPAPQQTVRQIPSSDLAKKAGLPVTPEAANVISGIVKDPRGNPLSNILIEVKDATNTPVRAFKTNGLGQFASATPLSNGAYTIILEDPKGGNKFDEVAFNATGAVILPIEVISSDTREELRRSLFGNVVN